jgi:transcription initiation factor IIE alpha subunit
MLLGWSGLYVCLRTCSKSQRGRQVHNLQACPATFLSVQEQECQEVDVCRVDRVPYGFHGDHITEEQFQQQLAGH